MIVAPVSPIPRLTVTEMKAVANMPPVEVAGFMRFTIPFNLAGVPSLTLPMTRSADGTPLGFQLIGPELGETKLLSAGAAYEAASGFSTLHPDI
jgi:Asp-tRNA(Asn)/Glu-tRNA(Gln) amidotransferase A subunit family amidase